MPNKFNDFWRAVEGRIEHAVLPIEWKHLLGEAYPRMLPFMVPTTRRAPFYPSPHGWEQPSWDIYDMKDGTFDALPEWDREADPLVLQPQDVHLVRWNMVKFRNEVVSVLKLEPTLDQVLPKDSIIRLGNYRVPGGGEHPVFMVCAQSGQMFRNDTASLLLEHSYPFFIITGSRIVWDGDVLNVIKRRNVQLLAMDDILEIKDGKFIATPAWEGAIEAFRQAVCPDNLVAVPPFEFRKKGEIWVIRFEGEETYLKDSQGLRCIAQLLAKPNDPVFVTELRAVLSGQPPDTVVQKTAREDVVDQATLSSLKRRYLELQAELAEAQTDGNDIMEQEAEQEMEQIVQHLCQIKGMHGETRKMNDDFEKARSATSKAFWRSVNLLRDDAPQLATHLETSCVVGMVCNYTPRLAVDWIL